MNARACDNADAAKAHFRLAGLYLNRAHSGDEDKDVHRILGAACGGGSGS